MQESIQFSTKDLSNDSESGENIELVIRYKLINVRRDSDGEEVQEEDEYFSQVSSELINRKLKVRVLCQKREQVDLVVTQTELFSMLEKILPASSRISTMQYSILNNGKIVWYNNNQPLEKFIKFTVNKQRFNVEQISSIINNEKMTLQSKRYEIKLDLKLTIEENQGQNLDSDNDYFIDEKLKSSSQSQSKNSIIDQVENEPSRDQSPTIEARITRMEKMWLNLADTIHQTFKDVQSLRPEKNQARDHSRRERQVEINEDEYHNDYDQSQNLTLENYLDKKQFKSPLDEENKRDYQDIFKENNKLKNQGLQRIDSNEIMPTATSLAKQQSNYDIRYNDIVYLSANPLILIQKDDYGTTITPNPQLEIKKEIEEICEILQNTNRVFNIEFQICRETNLAKALKDKTQIIHISSHGQIKDDKTSLTLQGTLNNSENVQEGVGCKVYEDQINQILEHINEQVKLVFVSACHSEKIGKVFKKKGVPIVIAVNQQTAISDKVCRIFTKYFYERLLNGMSPRVAFQQANHQVMLENMGTQYCCCHHEHKIGCPWKILKDKQNGIKDKIIQQDTKLDKKESTILEIDLHDLFHNQKICSCNPKVKKSLRYFEHQNSEENICNFAINHATNMSTINRRFNQENEEQLKIIQAKKEQKIYFGCCCQTVDEHPHEENKKIKFIEIEDVKDEISQENYIEFEKKQNLFMNEPIFNNYQKGSLNMKGGEYSKKNHLKLSNKFYNLKEREQDIQKIVHFISKGDKRLIHIYGEDGNGKCDITKFAVQYALEGRVTLDSAHHLNIEKIRTKQELKQKIFEEIRNHLSIMNYQDQKISEENYFENNKYVVILDKCQSFINQDVTGFSKALNSLQSQAKKAIFIVISDDLYHNGKKIVQTDDTVLIEQLNDRDAVELFTNSIKDQNLKFKFKKEIAIGSSGLKERQLLDPQSHRFFKDYKRKNEKIYHYAQLINDKKDFWEQLDNFADLREREGTDKIIDQLKDDSVLMMN